MMRQERGLSLQQAAEAAGISFGLLSLIETGKSGASPAVVTALADLFEIDADRLFVGLRAPAGYVIAGPYGKARGWNVGTFLRFVDELIAEGAKAADGEPLAVRFTSGARTFRYLRPDHMDVILATRPRERRPTGPRPGALLEVRYDLDAFDRLREEGKGDRAIAEKLGMSRSSVRRVRASRNVPALDLREMRDAAIESGRERESKRLGVELATIAELARRAHVSPGTFEYYIRHGKFPVAARIDAYGPSVRLINVTEFNEAMRAFALSLKDPGRRRQWQAAADPTRAAERELRRVVEANTLTIQDWKQLEHQLRERAAARRSTSLIDSERGGRRSRTRRAMSSRYSRRTCGSRSRVADATSGGRARSPSPLASGETMARSCGASAENTLRCSTETRSSACSRRRDKPGCVSRPPFGLSFRSIPSPSPSGRMIRSATCSIRPGKPCKTVRKKVAADDFPVAATRDVAERVASSGAWKARRRTDGYG
jgi:transcriptional regulator with XRE-family HTH domain